MVFTGAGSPLALMDLPIPEPAEGQVLVRIHACAVCRTDLHIIDGELPQPKLPLIPGHQIVGEVIKLGKGVDQTLLDKFVGIPWLGWTCGECKFCKNNAENLCPNARFTGYTIDGGFAEYTVADARYAFLIPEPYSPVESAPLLCAGLIGFRAFTKTASATHIGIYGFGSAAHIITQVARYLGKSIYAFTKPGDKKAQEFAMSLGAVWAGDSYQLPPIPLDAAIIFAPDGRLLISALKATEKGGIIVCGGIYMSDIPSFPYKLLWEERRIVSVANLTREDGKKFFEIAPKVPVKTKVNIYPLEEANKALADLKAGRFEGSAVLKIRNP